MVKTKSAPKPKPYTAPTQQVVTTAPKTANIGMRAILNWAIVNGMFGPGEHMKGGRAITREVAQEIINSFADNQIYDSQVGNKTINGELTAYAFSKKFFTDYLGFLENANGGFSDSNPDVKSGALAFIEDFKDVDNQRMTYRVNVLYDCKFTEPSIDTSTTEDGVEYTELVAPYSSKPSEIALDDRGNQVSYFWFIVPYGYSLNEVIEFLGTCPLPTDELLPQKDVTPPVLSSTTSTITTWTTADDGTKTFGDIVTECSVTAIDDVDGNVASAITYKIGSTSHAATDLIDIGTVGTVTVILNVSDLSGNASTPLTITITVSA